MARKLGLSPGEIIEFLGKHQISLSEGSNTRLEDDHVTLVVRQFAPAMAETILSAKKAEDTIPEKESEPEVQPEIALAEAPLESLTTVPAIEPAEAAQTNQFVALEPENGNVIKAPKAALPGLKVVGKIDLPEPKKKEPKQPENNPEEAAPDNSSAVEKNDPYARGRKRENKGRPNSRSGKNPLALKREREARAAEKQKELQKQLEKERRTQRYLKKIKPAVPTKPARIYDEQVVEMSEEQSKRPSTLWGRFMKWFWRQ